MVFLEDKVLLALFILLVVLGILLLRRRRPAERKHPEIGERQVHEEIKDFLSPTEHSFLKLLDEAAGNDLRVFAKVPVSYLLRNRKITLRDKDKKIVDVEVADFILCRSDLRSVVGVVLLDPGTKGDSPAEKAMRSAGLAVARFSAMNPPAIQELRQVIAGMKTAGRADIGSAGVEDWVIGAISRQAPTENDDWQLGDPLPHAGKKKQGATVEEITKEQAGRTCPACGAEMVRHRASRGPQAGKYFWSCASYPRCPQVLPDSPEI